MTFAHNSWASSISTATAAGPRLAATSGRLATCLWEGPVTPKFLVCWRWFWKWASIRKSWHLGLYSSPEWVLIWRHILWIYLFFFFFLHGVFAALCYYTARRIAWLEALNGDEHSIAPPGLEANVAGGAEDFPQGIQSLESVFAYHLKNITIMMLHWWF